jgi:hypothetical protein
MQNEWQISYFFLFAEIKNNFISTNFSLIIRGLCLGAEYWQAPDSGYGPLGARIPCLLPGKQFAQTLAFILIY